MKEQEHGDQNEEELKEEHEEEHDDDEDEGDVDPDYKVHPRNRFTQNQVQSAHWLYLSP